MRCTRLEGPSAGKGQTEAERKCLGMLEMCAGDGSLPDQIQEKFCANRTGVR